MLMLMLMLMLMRRVSVYAFWTTIVAGADTKQLNLSFEGFYASPHLICVGETAVRPRFALLLKPSGDL
jgi:hypothetical protein